MQARGSSRLAGCAECHTDNTHNKQNTYGHKNARKKAIHPIYVPQLSIHNEQPCFLMRSVSKRKS